MKLTLTIRSGSDSPRMFVEQAIAGLGAINPAGEELLAALEELLDPPPAYTVTDVDVLDALRAHDGNVKATARALGIARSTVRARVARSAKRAANDNA